MVQNFTAPYETAFGVGAPEAVFYLLSFFRANAKFMIYFDLRKYISLGAKAERKIYV